MLQNVTYHMNIWNGLQKMSFKKMSIVFLILITATFLGIYATCGSIYKVDCHEVMLHKFPRGV